MSKKKKLLIVKNDGLGDWLLFRQYLPCIRNSKKFKDYEITFLSNAPIISFIKDTTDKQYFDKLFIFTGYKAEKIKDSLLRFIGKYQIRYNYCKMLSEKYDIVVDMNTARFLYVDDFINKIYANEKISLNDTKSAYTTLASLIYHNKFTYTKLLNIDNNIFMSEQLSKYVGCFIEEDIPHIKPYLPFEKEEIDKTLKKFHLDDFYCFIPFSSTSWLRDWNIENFIKCADFINSKTDIPIVILGEKKSKEKSNELKTKSMNKHIVNLTGETSIKEAAIIASMAKKSICVDTFLMHCSLLGGGDTIVISNGSCHKSCTEYPSEFSVREKIFYPTHFYSRKNIILSNLNINDISVEEIVKFMQKEWFV
jgi:ADP-heptose:LPS heptosyltransferase